MKQLPKWLENFDLLRPAVQALDRECPDETLEEIYTRPQDEYFGRQGWSESTWNTWLRIQLPSDQSVEDRKLKDGEYESLVFGYCGASDYFGHTTVPAIEYRTYAQRVKLGHTSGG